MGHLPAAAAFAATFLIPHPEMASPQLPPEIVDKVIDNLTEDETSLRSCSAISTLWFGRSRYHLFRSLKLGTLEDLKIWFRTDSEKLEPRLRSTDYVHSLYLTDTDMGPPLFTPDVVAGLTTDLPSFPYVESLTLDCLDLISFDGKSLSHLFGRCSSNLTSLNITNSKIQLAQLLFLVCTFPKLENLKLDRIETTVFSAPFEAPSPTTNPTFGGKLALLNLKIRASAIVHLLVNSLSPMAFTDVSVENCDFGAPDSLNDLFIACQEKVKRIKLYSNAIYICELHLCGSFNNTHVSSKYCILDAS